MKLRLVCFDHYAAPPLPGLDPLRNPLDGSLVERVPVLRVFGATQGGQKCCLHLHSVFPYFLLRLPPQYASLPLIPAFAQNLRSALSRALGVSLKKSGGGEGQYVHDVIAVRGKPYYGFHGAEELMVKVLVYQPGMVARMADILRSGALLQHKFEVLEAHVPFKLQVCIDYSLYGMDFIELSRFWFRESLPSTTARAWHGHPVAAQSVSGQDEAIIYVKSTVPPQAVVVARKKQSSCALEIDAHAEHVVNAETMLREPPSTQSQVPLVKSLAVLWEEERKRCGGATPVIPPALGNASTDDAQIGERDKRLRELLRQLVAGRDVNTCTVMTGAAPDELMGLPKANAINWGRSSEASQSQSFSQAEQAALVNEEILSQVEALVMMMDQEDVEDDQDEGNQFFDDLKASQAIVANDLRSEEVSPDISEQPAAPIRFREWNAEEDEEDEEDEQELVVVIEDAPSPNRGSQTPLSQQLQTYVLAERPPTRAELANDATFRPAHSKWAYFGNPKDAASRGERRLIGGEQFVAAYHRTPAFAPGHGAALEQLVRRGMPPDQEFVYTLAVRPPSASELAQSVVPPAAKKRRPALTVSQIEAPFSGSVGGPKWKSGEAASQREVRCEHLLLLAVEVFAPVAPTSPLLPSPERDAVALIAYHMHDETIAAIQGPEYRPMSGVMYVDPTRGALVRNVTGFNCDVYATEDALLSGFADLVKLYDPDFVAGFEMQKNSLGYLIDRAIALGRADYGALLARVYKAPQPEREQQAQPQQQEDDYDMEEEGNDAEEVDLEDAPIQRGRVGKRGGGQGSGAGAPMGNGRATRWALKKSSGFELIGRILLNVWQVLKSDVALSNYSYQSLAFHVLHRRVPLFTPRVLSEWYRQTTERWRVMRYYLDMCAGDVALLQAMNVIERTSQLAKVFGIDFTSVLTRGSQYRVESMMLRLTRINNYVLLSPSRKQVNEQHPPMCVPLIMEPQSNFYHDPVLVLDFQSLYPSMIIAYNLCYSTCLGMLSEPPATRFGCLGHMPVSAETVAAIGSDNITIAPTDRSHGVMFVKSHVRGGVVPAMLTEILETRKMVKARMKTSGDRPLLKQMLDFCQLALKLIANVTYGYTSASFSGRMPCIDLADSIVGLGRRTTENAKTTIEAEWPNCRVIYGDTDSLFVLCRGSSHAESFVIGDAIAARITALNPRPVKLNFEKVYHPCVLQSKKRYVGWKFESPSQTQGTLDAKGIEIIRRDSCPAVQKILTKTLRMLFTNPDLSRIKEYHQRQYRKIFSGRISMQDFIFCKAVKMGTYAAGRQPPPAAIVAEKNRVRDQRREPLYNERVRFVVVWGSPNELLSNLVRDPDDLLNPRLSLHLNSIYYITKQILPALERVFSVMGINVRAWFEEIPRNVRVFRPPAGQDGRKNRIDDFFGSVICPVCHNKCPPSRSGAPVLCEANPVLRKMLVDTRQAALETEYLDWARTCRSCAPYEPLTMRPQCCSLECPVFFAREKSFSKL